MWHILVTPQTTFNVALWVTTYKVVLFWTLWYYFVCHYQTQPQFSLYNSNITRGKIKRRKKLEPSELSEIFWLLNGVCRSKATKEYSEVQALLPSYSPLLKDVLVLLKHIVSFWLYIYKGKNKCCTALAFSMWGQSISHADYKFKSNPEVQ